MAASAIEGSYQVPAVKRGKLSDLRSVEGGYSIDLGTKGEHSLSVRNLVYRHSFVARPAVCVSIEERARL